MKLVIIFLYSIFVVCLDNILYGCIFEFFVRNYFSEKRFENRFVDFIVCVYM